MSEGRLEAGFRTLVDRLTSGARFLARYPGRILSAGAGGLDVKLDTSDLVAPNGLPVRLGLPGCRVTPSSGTRATLAFEHGADGQPSPAVVSFEQGDDVVELRIAGGIKGAARLDDSVDLGWLSGSAPGGSGGPVTFTLSSSPGPNSVHLVGKITSSSSKVKVG